jgi:hypothetical protein
MSIISFIRNLFTNKPIVENFIYPDGTQCWQLNGLRHREDSPAVIYPCGTQYWYQNGYRHRTNGPAIICDEYQAWYLNGKRHREDGPAIIRADGSEEWYLNGEPIEYNAYHKSKIHFQEIKFTIKDGL